MIKTTAMLLEELSEYGSPKSKLSRMAKSGEYFPITKGIYETNRHTSAYLLAGSIYGPSYISSWHPFVARRRLLLSDC
ncbi:hypothetical protein HMPREF9124_0369 [Oribacterium sp. oral taxon 108 str. F0425]|nr:hypothetical protein HMPREF9124_0369 [Oribacterium sp. oral taxon 108 str. F0425]